MRVFITGSNGFLGAHLAQMELDRGNEVVCIIREFNHKTRYDILDSCIIIHGDITDITLIERILSDYEIDLIYHVASQPIVRIADKNPMDTFYSNIIGTANILEAVRNINKKIKTIIMSSDKAYGIQENLPYHEGMSVKATDPYGTSKACADLLAQTYFLSYGLNVNIIRCANIYGPGDMNQSRLIPGTINRILKGLQPQIYSGVVNYKREFIYVTDVCDAFRVLAEKGIPGEAYNIGDQEGLTVMEVMQRICRLMKYEGEIETIEKEFLEIPFQWLSAEKIRQLGWEKRTSLTNGLENTIKWYDPTNEESGN